MTIFDKMSVRIIKEQEFVIGPLAWDEARKVRGLEVVDMKKGEVHLAEGDQKVVVDGLVAQYERIFGRASHEVCRDAVQSILAEIPKEDIPLSLR